MKTLIRKAHGELVFDRRTRVLADALSGLLPEGAAVLDVGAGDGTIAGLCLERRPDIRVEGIDVQVRPNTRIPVRPFDGVTLLYGDRSMDVVMFIDVLHHTPDPHALVAEAARVARHAVVIKDHIANNRVDFATLALMDWVGNAPHEVASPCNYLSRSEWESLFRRAGLAARSFTTDVPLYGFPLSAVCGRELHFVASLSAAAEHQQAA